MILGAFLLAIVAVLPAYLPSLAPAVDAVLLPLIFVGMALLLFAIAMHLHLLHLDIVAQRRRRREREGGPAERASDA